VIEPRGIAPVGRSSGPPQRTEGEQRAFFNAALDRSLAAEASTGIVERCFALAGFVLSLKFAGDALARCFTPALAHLEVPLTTRPDAVFHIWDSESTGTAMVPPSCAHGCFTSRGDIWTMGSQRFKSAYVWSEFALNLFNTDTATGVYWTQAAEPLPNWAKASPLRCLFHWWAETKACQLVHGAAIGGEGGAVLVTGKGGLGKSTTALSCLSKGLGYVGDDYVVVQLDPLPRVHSLYCTAKLNRDQMVRFPRFAALTRNDAGAESEKAVMYLYPELNSQIARSLPLLMILTPRIAGGQQTAVEAVSRLALQRAAAFTTMSQLPRASRRTHEFIDQLVGRLPGLQLALGNNLGGVADVIVRLLTNPGREVAWLSNRTDSVELTGRPFVSVIISVCKSAALLPQSVASVLAQAYSAIEIIVVDDGSGDEVDAIVRNLPVDVRVLRQRRAGLAAARNRGIRECSGELVAFLDAGDLWPLDGLQRMVDFLQADSSCDIVRGLGQVMKVDADGTVPEVVESVGQFVPDCPAAAIFRREVFETAGLFDLEDPSGEDHNWYDRIREHCLKLRQVDKATLLMRRREAGVSGARSPQELSSLRMLKKALDRERAEVRRRP
jgi:hypothetical protein